MTTTPTTPVTIIGKMEVRTGLAIELPGQPLTGTSIAPPGLDPGELGFAKDTGELFIGTDPNYPIFDDDRLEEYPYANIQVLTDTQSSIDFIKNVAGQLQNTFSSVVIPANTSGPTGTTDLVWNTPQTNVAEIRYMLCFDNVPTVVRKGTLTVVMNQSEANIQDIRVDVGMEIFNYTDPTPYENYTVFEFSVSVLNGVVTLIGDNTTNTDAKLYYSVLTYNAQF
jgi:hypothetical protein